MILVPFIISAGLAGAAVGQAPASRPTTRPSNVSQQSQIGNYTLILPPQYSRQQVLSPQDQAFKAANDLCLQGRFEEAVKAFAAIARQYPSHHRAGDALFFEGLALTNLGRYSEAVEVYLGLVKARPSHVYADDALFKAAEVCERRLHDYDRASKLYERYLTEYPAGLFNIQAISNNGRVNLKQRNFEEANREYNNVIAANNAFQAANVANWVSNAAQVATQPATENYYVAQATERIEFLKVHSDHNYEPLKAYMDAVDLDKAGRSEECRKALETLIAKWPDAAIVDDCKLYLADMLRRQGELRQAAEAYEAWLKAYPASPVRHRAWFALGEYYRLTDRYADARRAYNETKAARPDSPEAARAQTRLNELRDRASR